MVVQDEPQLMLWVGLFHPENCVIIQILLLINPLLHESLAVGDFGIKKAITVIRNTLDHKNLTDKNHSRC